MRAARGDRPPRSHSGSAAWRCGSRAGRVGRRDKVTALIGKVGQELMGAAVHQFHRGVARELLKRPLIAIDVDVTPCRGLRVMIAPPPKWVSIQVSWGDMRVMIA